MSKKNQRDPQKTEFRPPLDSFSKHWLFSGLIRNPIYFTKAVDRIKEEHFTEADTWLRLVWGEVVHYYRNFDQHLTKDILLVRCNGVLELNPKALTDKQMDELDQFITMTYDMAEDAWPVAAFMDILQQFLEDRLVAAVMTQLSHPQIPVSLDAMMSVWADSAAAIRTLSHGGLKALSTDWYQKNPVAKRISTGLKWLDDQMHGGMVRGESYGLLGPTGGGKTTLAVQIGCESARRAYEQWLADGQQGQPERVYHVTYEDPEAMLQIRTVSYLAKMPKERVELVTQEGTLDVLSTIDNLQDYEKRRFKKQLSKGLPVMSELERYQQAFEIISRCYRVIDFSGMAAADGKICGQGLIEEIAATIRQDLANNPGVGVSMIPIDYVLAAVESNIEALGLDHSELRHKINRWPFNARKKLAVAFDCPVWSCQQLNTDANHARPGTLPKVSESAEGRAFSFNCDYCFVLGVPQRNGMVPFACGKHRRTRGRAPVVLKLRGDLCAFFDTGGRCVYNERTKTIDEAEVVKEYLAATGRPEIYPTTGLWESTSLRNGGLDGLVW
jgi:hypothetical protein